MTDGDKTQSTQGLLRVTTWGFGYAVFGVLAFVNESEKGVPRWWILVASSAILVAVSIGDLRNLLNQRPRTFNEARTTVYAILGAALLAAFILGISYFYNSAYAMHLTGMYVIPATAMLTTVFAVVAWHIERKSLIRVFIGNKGWVFIARRPPSNSTVERDARKSSARPSP